MRDGSNVARYALKLIAANGENTLRAYRIALAMTLGDEAAVYVE